jgi:hypothetical protein
MKLKITEVNIHHFRRILALLWLIQIGLSFYDPASAKFILLELFLTIHCFKAIVDYPSNKARWNNTYHCQRCGFLFLLRSPKM